VKRTTKYVALDVHQATTVASVREETGHVIARTILPTAGPAIVEFFRGSIPPRPLECTFFMADHRIHVGRKDSRDWAEGVSDGPRAVAGCCPLAGSASFW